MVSKFYLFSICLFLSFTIMAQDGSPDVSFGDSGVVLTSFGESFIDISSVSQGLSGRIAVLGTEYPVLVDTIHFIQVYNEDGTVDTSFGDNGIVKIVDNTGAPVNKINVLSDDSILFGYGGARKLLPNGAIDTAFGTNGYISLGLSLTDTLGHIIHPDGSIYVYGNKLTGDREFIIKKFDSNGIVDTSFGNQGLVFLFIDFLAVYSENKILFLDDDTLLVNYFYDTINYVIKIDNSGQIDNDFGDNGYVESYFGGLVNSNFHKLDSGIFFISYALDANGGNFRRVESYLPNGTLDSSFADNGILSNHTVSIIQQDQRLITRQDTPDINNDYLPDLSRVLTNGSSDSSFNFQFNYTALSTPSVSQTADGKIIIAGANNDFPESNLVVLRYNNTPLSVEEQSLHDFKISPNPANDIVQITCPQCNLSGENYSLMDTTGKTILKGVFENNYPSINISTFNTGLYFLNTAGTTLKLLKK